MPRGRIPLQNGRQGPELIRYGDVIAQLITVPAGTE